MSIDEDVYDSEKWAANQAAADERVKEWLRLHPRVFWLAREVFMEDNRT